MVRVRLSISCPLRYVAYFFSFLPEQPWNLSVDSFGWLVGWLVGRLAYCCFGVFGWLNNRFIDLFDCLIYYLFNLLFSVNQLFRVHGVDIRSFFFSFIRLFCLFIHSFIHSLIHSFRPLLIHPSFIRSSILYSFTPYLVSTFISFIHTLTHSFSLID